MFPHARSMGISHSGDQTATRRLRGMDDGRHAGIPVMPDVIGIGTSVATDAGTGVPPPAPPGDFSRPVPSHGESHTEKHADVADSTTPVVEPISRLMGVRPDDGMRGQSAKRDVPRLRFRPFHAVTVMLVLTTALCASLTMLLQQSLRYVSAQSHNAAMQNAGGKETGIAETLPGGSDGSDSVNGDGSNSAERAPIRRIPVGRATPNRKEKAWSPPWAVRLRRTGDHRSRGVTVRTMGPPQIRGSISIPRPQSSWIPFPAWGR